MFNSKKKIEELERRIISINQSLASHDSRIGPSRFLGNLVLCSKCGQVFSEARCIDVQYGYYCEKHMDKGAPHKAALYWTKKNPKNAMPIIKAAKQKGKS